MKKVIKISRKLNQKIYKFVILKIEFVDFEEFTSYINLINLFDESNNLNN